MNKKHFAIFVAITVIVLVASVIAVNKEQSAVVNQDAGAMLFPGLEAKANDVAKVEIVKGEDRTTIQSNNGKWVVTDRDNYPADVSKVKEAIMKIAGFTTVEAKTKKEDNYGKLNVEDPTKEDAKSILVTLKDKSDSEMAALVIGRQVTGSFTTVGQDQTYVRKMNDPQVWLVKGALTLDESANDWLVEDLLNVAMSRVSQVTIKQADGSFVTINKEKPGEGDYIIQNLPKNQEVESQADLAKIPKVLENLRLEDVQKTDAVEFPEDKSIKTEIKTFDGLVINAVTKKQNQDYLVKITVKFDASIRPPVAETSAEPKSETPADEAHAKPQPPKLKDAAAVQLEATEINEKVSPWVFTVTRTKGLALTRKLDDLVKDKS